MGLQRPILISRCQRRRQLHCVATHSPITSPQLPIDRRNRSCYCTKLEVPETLSLCSFGEQWSCSATELFAGANYILLGSYLFLRKCVWACMQWHMAMLCRITTNQVAYGYAMKMSPFLSQPHPSYLNLNTRQSTRNLSFVKSLKFSSRELGG